MKVSLISPSIVLNSPRIQTIFLAGKPSAKWSGIRRSKIISRKKIVRVVSQFYMPGSFQYLQLANAESCLDLRIHFAQGRLNLKSDSLSLWHSPCLS